MLKELPCAGFVVSWDEPPRTTVGWELNIAPTTDALGAKLRNAQGGEHGSKVILAQTREDGLAQAKAFIAKLKH